MVSSILSYTWEMKKVAKYRTIIAPGPEAEKINDTSSDLFTSGIFISFQKLDHCDTKFTAVERC